MEQEKQAQWCVKCRTYEWSAYYRPELRRVLCNGHYFQALRERTATGLVKRPRHLPKYLREAE